jgi:hypothetical protein
MASLYGLNAQTAITELTFVLVWRQKAPMIPEKSLALAHSPSVTFA